MNDWEFCKIVFSQRIVPDGIAAGNILLYSLEGSNQSNLREAQTTMLWEGNPVDMAQVRRILSAILDDFKQQGWTVFFHRGDFGTAIANRAVIEEHSSEEYLMRRAKSG